MLSGILRPYDAGEKKAFPMSTVAKNPNYEGPDLIEPLERAP